MYEFTNDCLIGIKEIDDEHARLFKMVNDAIAMSNELDDITPVANNLIANLKDYAQHTLPTKRLIWRVSTTRNLHSRKMSMLHLLKK